MKNKLSECMSITVAVLAIATCSCNSAESKQSDKAATQTAAPATPVSRARDVQPVKKDKLATSFRTPGELLAFQQVDLYAREVSYVKKLYVDVGSNVKAGQLLVTMDAPEISQRLAAAESRVKSKEAIFGAASSNYQRLYETSKTPGTISPNDLEQAESRKNSERAQLEAARSALREVGITKGYLEVRAPFNGVITARNINPGAYVGPAGKGSESPMFTLQQQDKLRLVVSVPEAYTGYLRSGDEVNFSVKALPDQQFKAKIARLAGALDLRLRSERVEMDVSNAGKRLLPGMIAEVNIPMPARDSSFIVPATAVVSSQERVFVIRVHDNKANWVEVQKGRIINGQTEVFGKLTEGDLVIVEANEEIRDGSEVEVKLQK
ncbi:MAG: efflux RND transporter periplasmic adaptor subunit [Chitinophagaceae bacterium]|nr:MAG: efflux RND transporter periplasmic adaptor subunit [Chitinophagaceae bacterium]